METVKKKLVKDDFDHYYSIVHREFTKISQNVYCNAIEAYDAIFIITTNNGDYDEALYWLIGDFIYTFAKERRKIIYASDDWFDAYTKEFRIFSNFLESIDAICSVLNALLILKNKGRKINDFGYLLWEKCVIQQLKNAKRISFSDYLIQNLEETPKNFLEALKSLTLIIPDPEKILFYYQSTYEDLAIKKITSKYENIEIDESIICYFSKCKKIFDYENTRKYKIFIRESFAKIHEKLQQLLISKNSKIIRNKIISVLQNDDTLANELFFILSENSTVFVELFKETLKTFIKKKIKDECIKNNKKQNEEWFFSLYNMYLKALRVYNSCYPDDDKLINKIFSECLERCKDPNFDERIAEFSNITISSSTFERNKDIFEIFITQVTSKSVFAEFFMKYFSKRLLSYCANFKKELLLLDIIKKKINLCEVTKCLKMIKDINGSISINKNVDVYLKSKNFFFKNTADFFVTILTQCNWPLSDSQKVENVILPDELKNYYTKFIDFYKYMYSDRRLTLNNDLGYVDIEINTDKIYNIRLNLYQYIILEKFNHQNSYSIEKLANLTNIKSIIIKEIINVLSSLIIKKKNLYFFNDKFYNRVKAIDFKDNLSCFKEEKNTDFDLLAYYKVLIARLSKKHKEISCIEFIKLIKENLLNELKFDNEMYKLALEENEIAGVLEIREDFIYYEV
ncbi:Cullin-1 [Gurleya vavrai]